MCLYPDPDHPFTAVWMMRAPAVPPPGPDDWVNTGVIRCLAPATAAPQVVVSERDFRRLPIPAPEILTQPATQVTLINIGTNFLTEQHPVVLPATVLGQQVRVRATPARYTWAYGDGHTLTTSDPGHRYPSMPAAHTYTRPGTYTISLATTFTGEFSLTGGPWQPIHGTATTWSPPLKVTAEERRAVLTG